MFSRSCLGFANRPNPRGLPNVEALVYRSQRKKERPEHPVGIAQTPLASLLSAHPLYLGLGADDDARRAAYRDLFSSALDGKPLAELRLALNQDQPAGNDRFYREIEAMTGQRRELRKRGRPRKRDEPRSGKDFDQAGLPL